MRWKHLITCCQSAVLFCFQGLSKCFRNPRCIIFFHRFLAAQRGQQRPGLIRGSDGDLHQSGPHRGHVCGGPGAPGPGPGNRCETEKTTATIRYFWAGNTTWSITVAYWRQKEPLRRNGGRPGAPQEENSNTPWRLLTNPRRTVPWIKWYCGPICVFICIIVFVTALRESGHILAMQMNPGLVSTLLFFYFIFFVSGIKHAT